MSRRCKRSGRTHTVTSATAKKVRAYYAHTPLRAPISPHTAMTTSPLSLLKDPTLLKTDALVNGQWVVRDGRHEAEVESNRAFTQVLRDLLG